MSRARLATMLSVELSALDDVRKKLPDERVFDQVFGKDKEARRALDALRAAPQAFDDIVQGGRNAGDAIDRDFAKRMESPIQRIDTAMNGLKEKSAEAFTPERIEAFADMIERVVKGLSDAANWVGDIKDYLQKNTAEQQSPYTAKPEDMESSWISKVASIGVGGAMISADKQSSALVTNAAMSGAANDPSSPEFLKRNQMNHGAFVEQWDEIQGAGTNRKRRLAAARAAYGARYGLADNAEPGAEGRERAGLRWIASEKITGKALDTLIDEMRKAAGAEQSKAVVQAIAGLPAAIAAAMGGAPVIEIANEKVSKAERKSTDPRRGL